MKEHVWIPSRNGRLSAMIHLPETFREGDPLVVCCHGFTGDKVGSNQLTRNLAAYLERSGYGVVRFDYIGSGDSDGEFSTDTFVAGWKEDLVNVFAWLEKQEQLAASPIVLYGHSLGGLIALTHKDISNRVVARAVFAPVTRPVENFRDIILGTKLWKQSLAGEEIGNFYGKGFRLQNQFIRDLLDGQYDPIQEASQLSTPLLIVHGTIDQAVPIQGSRELHAAYQGAKELVELEIDHVATGAQEQLQAILSGWLEKIVPLR